jgi:hypothetical protein
MRYDRKVWFVNESESVYDEATGDYTDPVVERIFRLANITTTGEQSMVMLYGKIRQGAYTVRVQNGLEAPYQHIEVDSIGNKYLVDSKKQLRNDLVLKVSESQ